MKPPVFTSGNAAFKKALNSVVEFAKVHGVNPGGRPGWNQTADGWMPPYLTNSGASGPVFWDLQVTDSTEGKVKIINPGIVKRTSAYDASGLVSIASIDDEFTAVADSALILKVTADLTTTLEMVTTDWTGWPYPHESEETTPPGLWVMKFYRLILWDFVASSSRPDSIKVAEEVFAERRIMPSHLQFELVDTQDSDGHVIAGVQLVPAPGCRTV